MRFKTIAQNGLLVLAGTAVGLALGECGLRLSGFEEEVARRATTFDPRWGTVRSDSWIFDFEIEPTAAEVRLRGQRVPLAKRPGEIRVLFIGDSGTEGVRVALEDTYPAQLARLLDAERPGHAVVTINAGVFGMTTIDEIHFLTQRLLPLDPDVVVVGLFMANDLNFNLAHTERSRTVRPRSDAWRTLVDGSALAHFLYLRLLTLNAHHRWLDADDLAEESVIPREIALVDAYGFHMLSYPAGEVATYAQPPSALVERAFSTLERVLDQLLRLGERHGFRVRVLIIPTPSTIAGRLTLLHYPNVRDDLRAAGIDIDGIQLDFDAPTRRVLETCGRLDIVCFDPTRRMREIGSDVFFPDDEHPTVAGHAVLATELAAGYDALVGD
jgi:lysophospholipase L1-like esterase